MPRLKINDDGTIDFPLRRNEQTPEGEQRVVVLEEPSMAQMAHITELAKQADDAVTQLTPIDLRSTDLTAEALTTYTDQVNARTVEMFGDQAPYGNAMMEVVAMLSGETVGPDDLFAWAMSPRTLRTITEHFRAPLPGPVSEPT